MSERILDVVEKDIIVKMDYTLYVDGKVVDSSEGVWSFGIHSRPPKPHSGFGT